MRINRRLLLAFTSTLFAAGAFTTVGSQESPQDPGDSACSGADIACPGTCIAWCNPKDPNDCTIQCNTTKQ